MLRDELREITALVHINNFYNLIREEAIIHAKQGKSSFNFKKEFPLTEIKSIFGDYYANQILKISENNKFTGSYSDKSVNKLFINILNELLNEIIDYAGIELETYDKSMANSYVSYIDDNKVYLNIKIYW